MPTIATKGRKKTTSPKVFRHKTNKMKTDNNKQTKSQDNITENKISSTDLNTKCPQPGTIDSTQPGTSGINDTNCATPGSPKESPAVNKHKAASSDKFEDRNVYYLEKGTDFPTMKALGKGLLYLLQLLGNPPMKHYQTQNQQIRIEVSNKDDEKLTKLIKRASHQDKTTTYINVDAGLKLHIKSRNPQKVKQDDTQKEYWAIVQGLPEYIDLEEYCLQYNGFIGIKSKTSRQGQTQQITRWWAIPPEELDCQEMGRFPLVPFYNQPLRCNKCQCFGHHFTTCSANQTCAYCAGSHLSERCPNPRLKYCANCGTEGHGAFDKHCPKYLAVLQTNIEKANDKMPHLKPATLHMRHTQNDNSTRNDNSTPVTHMSGPYPAWEKTRNRIQENIIKRSAAESEANRANLVNSTSTQSNTKDLTSEIQHSFHHLSSDLITMLLGMMEVMHATLMSVIPQYDTEVFDHFRDQVDDKLKGFAKACDCGCQTVHSQSYPTPAEMEKKKEDTMSNQQKSKLLGIRYPNMTPKTGYKRKAVSPEMTVLKRQDMRATPPNRNLDQEGPQDSHNGDK